nr:MAG TPA: hypothetical protein [Bacteriophage sp.]
MVVLFLLKRVYIHFFLSVEGMGKPIPSFYL